MQHASRKKKCASFWKSGVGGQHTAVERMGRLIIRGKDGGERGERLNRSEGTWSALDGGC